MNKRKRQQKQQLQQQQWWPKRQQGEHSRQHEDHSLTYEGNNLNTNSGLTSSLKSKKEEEEKKKNNSYSRSRPHLVDHVAEKATTMQDLPPPPPPLPRPLHYPKPRSPCYEDCVMKWRLVRELRQSYRTATPLVGGPYFVAAYGDAACTEGRDGGRTHVMITNDRMTERMDLLLFPETIMKQKLDSERMRLLDQCLDMEPTLKRPCFIEYDSDTAYRSAILQRLWRGEVALDYYVYAALSPLHERSFVEICEIVRARVYASQDDYVSEDVSNKEIERSLMHLQNVGFATIVPYVPIDNNSETRTSSPKYDHNVGTEVNNMTRGLFPLTPGIAPIKGRILEKNIDALRLAVRALRHHWLLNSLYSSKLDDPSSSDITINTSGDMVSSRDKIKAQANFRRHSLSLTESELLFNILMCMGYRSSKHHHLEKMAEDSEQKLQEGEEEEGTYRYIRVDSSVLHHCCSTIEERIMTEYDAYLSTYSLF